MGITVFNYCTTVLTIYSYKNVCILQSLYKKFLHAMENKIIRVDFSFSVKITRMYEIYKYCNKKTINYVYRRA